MKDFDQVSYEAFFDELGCIEKVGMLSKFAGIRPGFLEQIWRGGKQLFRNPGAAGTAISKGWQRGVQGAGEGSRFLGGVRGALRTPQGKAALVGGGAVLSGVGQAGYLMGRRGQNQNVYVR
jgi:hypothetical protein